MAKKRGLGRGLDALLGAEFNTKTNPAEAKESAPDAIPVEWIQPGRYQPRQQIDTEPLEELAASIKRQGVIQPIALRLIGERRYEIIAGERRWRGAQLAGLDKIPAVIKNVSDEAAVAMSLIENIQREDLNPMDEAFALQRLVDEFNLTHQQVADAVGKSRTAVTNFLRLINLAAEVARRLSRGDIGMGHARALLGLSHAKQEKAAKHIVDRHLNVRQTEALVRKLLAAPPGDADNKRTDADKQHLETKLSARLGQPVHIQHTVRGKGKLIIKYNSLDELDGILERFGDLE